MKFNKNNEKFAKEGIVHFWDLPRRNHIILDTTFKDKLMKIFMKITRTKYNANKITNISRPTISDYINKNNPKIRIDLLLKIINIINLKIFDLNDAEINIKWIGHFNSQGIIYPKLPFNFNSRDGTRFLAAICNEGWISDGMYYSNSKNESRKSVKNDALKVFGGNNLTIKEWIREKDQYLAFPSIMRDVVNILTEFKGIKSERNPNIPSFIFKSKELMYGWLEQTIGDEGHVKYHPNTYRREIIWRRACDTRFDNCNLISNELKILELLQIKYDLKKIEKYKISNGKQRFKYQIRISRKENLKRLDHSIRIPNKFKNDLLIKMLNSC